ncbi:hypothetical protein AB0B45_13970 [Nonomuraea sp. NPDC049152]|uniref:hypothetical protein n=1 Tax=Nonomuraea sp. NPDC049152 TaxID=3154350 RepID=UPI0033F25349
MCDLNPQESRDIIQALEELHTLTGQAMRHATSIEDTAYMDHEGLAAVLTSLRDRTQTTLHWVKDRPQQHATHAGH